MLYRGIVLTASFYRRNWGLGKLSYLPRVAQEHVEHVTVPATRPGPGNCAACAPTHPAILFPLPAS